MDLTRVLLTIAWSVALARAEDTADPFNGKWKVDSANCKLGAIRPDPNRDVIKIDVNGEEHRTTYQDGRTLVVRVDGKPRKPAGGAFGSATGSDESTARRVDERTIEVTTKRDGRIVGKLSRHVSPDGRVLTFTTVGASATGESLKGVCVYHKQ